MSKKNLDWFFGNNSGSTRGNILTVVFLVGYFAFVGYSAGTGEEVSWGITAIVVGIAMSLNRL